MQRVINAAIIRDRKIVVLRKEKGRRSTWILPGGKPEKRESDLACLAREISEELPFLRLDKDFYYYGPFEGISPNRRVPILTEVYLHDGISNIDLRISNNPAEPIKESRLVDYHGLIRLPLSETSIRIVQSLKDNLYL